MKKLNAIIVDDEEQNIEVLKIKLEEFCPEVNILTTVSNPNEAIKLLNEIQLDLVFLDVEMPNTNGFAVLDALNNRKFEVIMVTAYNEYALQALKASAIDYLLKPIDTQELIIAVEKVKNKIDASANFNLIAQKIESLSTIMDSGKNKTNKIKLHSVKDIHFVNVNEIIRIEGLGNYCNFFMVDAPKVTVSRTLKDYEAQLPENTFFRIHKSHIINLEYLVRIIKSPEIIAVMSDGTEIEVSSRRKADFFKCLEG